MKKHLYLMLLLLSVSIIIVTGCRKKEGVPTKIVLTSLESPEAGVETGTFVATGGLSTTGTFVMDIELVGADSLHCVTVNTDNVGTFTTILNCSLITNEGKWYVQSGTGAYSVLQGRGTLLMRFPPDPDVPAGALGTETQIGVVWFHP